MTITRDTEGRVTGLTEPAGRQLSFSYSRTSLQITQVTDPIGRTVRYAYDGAGRLASVTDPAGGVTNYTYDANGNLASLTDSTGTTTFTWDARNRLSAVTGPGLMASFAYDSTGRRVQKTVNTVTAQFQYDRGNLVRELVEGREIRYLHSLRLDETLCRLDPQEESYYLADLLSSTVGLTDASGALRTTYTYEPFGQTAPAGLQTANPFQYTGRERERSGLYYYRARYFDPTLARFLAEDPIKIMGGSLNFYSYLKNRPLNFADPTGLLLLDCTRPLQGRLGKYGALHRFVWRDGRTYGFCSQGQDTSLSSFFRSKPGAACPAEAPDILPQASTSCQAVITDPLTEQCVEKVGQDLMTDANPPSYSLRSYNCQDWATEAFRRCGLNCPMQQIWPILRPPPLTELSITP